MRRSLLHSQERRRPPARRRASRNQRTSVTRVHLEPSIASRRVQTWLIGTHHDVWASPVNYGPCGRQGGRRALTNRIASRGDCVVTTDVQRDLDTRGRASGEAKSGVSVCSLYAVRGTVNGTNVANTLCLCIVCTCSNSSNQHTASVGTTVFVRLPLPTCIVSWSWIIGPPVDYCVSCP